MPRVGAISNFEHFLPMAWRIAKFVATGQIDNRSNGHIAGTLELAGDLGTISLDLEGNGHPDLAGCLIRFRNPRAEPPAGESPPTMGLAMEQTGHAGDMTASHRVKDLLVPLAEFREMDEAARASAFRWANGLYLEWFSEANGRVVVEGTGFEVEVIEGPHWTMSDAELREQAGRAARGMEQFLADSAHAVRTAAAMGGVDEELPQAEAEMDAEAARMDLLNERIGRRLEKEGPDGADFDQIYHEEAARLRRERGEPEPEPPTPEEEEERQCWIDEINADAEEALREAEADAWKGDARERQDHPLVGRCRTLAVKLRRDNVIPQGANQEHPLAEICDGVLLASGKLAGALNGCLGDEEWPPDELGAPAVLSFLKKARGYLRDALSAMDSADEEALASPAWREGTRKRVTGILLETQRLIEEARSVLRNNEDFGS
jgi:hypothetical protein